MENFYDFKLEPGKVLNKNIYSYKEPKISVIIPYYNDIKYIKQSVISVLNQTIPYFEILIIDDGSEEKASLEKLEKVKKLDDRIKVFHKKNEGLAATRDYGASKSSKTAEYLMFLDADDLLENTYLECAYWTMETNKTASWVYSDSIGFDKLSYTWNQCFDSNRLKKENYLVSASMIRKSDFIEVGGYGIREKFVNEDWNLWLKMLSKGKYPVHMSYYGQWYRRKETGELQKAKENKKKSLKIIKETAKNVKEKVEAIQYPKFDYNNDEIIEEIEQIEIPKIQNEKKKKVLMLIPSMTSTKEDRINLEVAKKLDKDKYRLFIITTQSRINNLRQQFEKNGVVYDLTGFLNQKYWFTFINYIVQKNNISTIINADGKMGHAFLPLIKAKNPSIRIINAANIENREKMLINEEKIKNGKELEKKIDKCKEEISSMFIENKDNYIAEVNNFYKEYHYGENYKFTLFKEKMWKFAPYRNLVKFLKNIR